MNTPKYLIAKYIPDLNRMEPRNIGIVVWSPEGIEARFLAEKPDSPGELDGRSIPTFVTSPSAYRQWVQFWRAELAKPDEGGKGDGGLLYVASGNDPRPLCFFRRRSLGITVI